MAIHKYIADKWKPELLGRDAPHRGHISMLANRVIDFKNEITGPCYGRGGNRVEDVLAGCDKHLPSILDYMGANTYLCGNEPSYVDFYFFESYQCAVYLSEGALLTQYPQLAAYNNTMKALLG